MHVRSDGAQGRLSMDGGGVECWKVWDAADSHRGRGGGERSRPCCGAASRRACWPPLPAASCMHDGLGRHCLCVFHTAPTSPTAETPSQTLTTVTTIATTFPTAPQYMAGRDLPG